MHKAVVLFIVGFVLGGLCVAGTIEAVQSALTAPVLFAIRDDTTGRILHGRFTVVATRVGSRYMRIEASGKTDPKGYIRTQVRASLPPAIVNILAPLLR